MRNKTLIFIAAACIAVLACPPLFSQAPKVVTRTAVVTVTVNVPNAKIIVDDTAYARNVVTLTIGPHLLKVTAPGYQDFEQRIDVRANMTVRVDLKPALYPLTIVVPQIRGLVVFIDDVQIEGLSFNAPAGTHKVRVTAPGYQDYLATINVAGPVTVNATLAASGYQLTILANVKDFMIFVDNAQISGNQIIVSPGAHTVRVSAPGYQDYQTSVNVGGPLTINAQLAAVGYQLTVNANVKVFVVFIDGNQINGNSAVVSPGSHTVRVSSPGYADYQTTVNMSGPLIIAPKLASALFPLTVVSNVKSITVFIDGVQMPGLIFNVTAGTHTVRVTAAGFQEYTTTVDVAGPQTINAQLVQAGYTLNVTSNVHGAAVFINNVEKGETPYTEVLPPGAYTIQVSAPGFTTYTTSLNLNGPITVSARLSEAQPAVVNLVLPRGLLDPQGREFNQIKVYVDGKPVNVKRDFTGIQIQAGRHKIAVSSGDLYVQSADLDLDGGVTYTVELFMELRLRAR